MWVALLFFFVCVLGCSIFGVCLDLLNLTDAVIQGPEFLYVFMIDFCILFQVIRGHYTPLNEVILEDVNLPGLTELRGSWHGSLDASGGGNGDTMVRPYISF